MTNPIERTCDNNSLIERIEFLRQEKCGVSELIDNDIRCYNMALDDVLKIVREECGCPVHGKLSNTNSMRTRIDIEADISTTTPDSFFGDSVLLEVLLDIRDLLTPSPEEPN